MTFLVYRIHFGCRRSRVPFYALYRKFNCIKSYQPFVLSHVFHFIVHCRTSFFLIFFFFMPSPLPLLLLLLPTHIVQFHFLFPFDSYSLCLQGMKWNEWVTYVFWWNFLQSLANYIFGYSCFVPKAACIENLFKLNQPLCRCVCIRIHSHRFQNEPAVSCRFVFFPFHSFHFPCRSFIRLSSLVLSFFTLSMSFSLRAFYFIFIFFLLFHFSQRKWSVVVSHVAAAF